MSAIPESAGGLFEGPGPTAGDVVTPGAVLGEGLPRVPVGGACEGHNRRREGVLRDVESEGGDPRAEANGSVSGEGPQRVVG
jgi:hypothetical protein